MYLFHACTPDEFGNEESHVTAYNGNGDLIDKLAWNMPIKVLKPDGTPLCTNGITLDMTTFESGGDTYAGAKGSSYPVTWELGSTLASLIKRSLGSLPASQRYFLCLCWVGKTTTF